MQFRRYQRSLHQLWQVVSTSSVDFGYRLRPLMFEPVLDWPRDQRVCTLLNSVPFCGLDVCHFSRIIMARQRLEREEGKPYYVAGVGLLLRIKCTVLMVL
jgi:hypothetical protein